MTSYEMCLSAANDTERWNQHAECLKAGDYIDYEYGCGYFMDTPHKEYQSLNIGNSHCETLHPESKEMKNNFNWLIGKLGVTKCK